MGHGQGLGALVCLARIFPVELYITLLAPFLLLGKCVLRNFDAAQGLFGVDAQDALTVDTLLHRPAQV